MSAYPVHEEFQSDHLTGQPQVLAQDFNHLAHSICASIRNPDMKTETLEELLKLRDQAIARAIAEQHDKDIEEQLELDDLFYQADQAKDEFGWPSFSHIPPVINRDEDGIPIQDFAD